MEVGNEGDRFCSNEKMGVNAFLIAFPFIDFAQIFLVEGLPQLFVVERKDFM